MKSILASVLTTILLFIGIVFLTGTTPVTDSDKSTETETKSAETKPVNATNANTTAATNQNIVLVPLPDYLTLGGEEVPLHQWDVRERLDREILVNTYWHSNTIRLLKLANRHFPQIEPMMEKHGVPDDMKYIALIESGLDVTASSPAGAKGPWQFMKSAAKQYNLEITDTEVDERYNWEKSTEAACKYLKNEYKSFNNWTLSAAAYNAGHGRIRKTMSSQKVDNYFDMYLTTETSRYVFRILAIKLIHSNPEKYGFHLNDSDYYHPIETKEIEVTSIDDIATFAIQNGTTYKELKLLNSWLRSTKLSKRSSGKKYIVRIPYS